MPFNKTDSPLKVKYGERNVARARDLMKARLGVRMDVYKYDDKLPWALIGTIARNAKKAGKIVTTSDIRKAQADFKIKGLAASLRKANAILKRTVYAGPGARIDSIRRKP